MEVQGAPALCLDDQRAAHGPAISSRRGSARRGARDDGGAHYGFEPVRPNGGRLALIERRAAHLARRDDGLVSVAPLRDGCAGRFADLVETEPFHECAQLAQSTRSV
jgi:hypothetical protein